MDHADLVVLGGGPAGAVSAIVAARDGLDVVLADPDRSPARLEGFSPRLRQWLGQQGLLEGFDTITGPLSRRVDWAGISESNAEYVVLRGALDRHLRACARAEGVRVIPASAEPVTGGVVLSDGQRIAAPQLIDARGRRPARPEQRIAPATLALCAWVRPGSCLAPGITLSAHPEGWIWCVALPDGRVWVQAMLDAAVPRGASRRPEIRLQAVLGSALPGRWQTASPIMAREAAPRLPDPVPDLTCLPVGDALAAVDPLSGHGQFWAVSSALAVAAVRRTLAAHPERAELCRRFLIARACDTAVHQARIGRDFLRGETRFAAQPFWQRRRNFPDDLPVQVLPDKISVRKTAVVRDGLVDEMEILLTPRSPAGIGWFGSIPAAEAFRLLDAGGEQAAVSRWGPRASGLARRLQTERVAPGLTPG